MLNSSFNLGWTTNLVGQKWLLRPQASPIEFRTQGNSQGIQMACWKRVRCELSTPTIFGMISPPFSTKTESPMRISNNSTWSALCGDARLTTVPANFTGLRFATGVTAPVRPTWKSTESKGCAYPFRFRTYMQLPTVEFLPLSLKHFDVDRNLP